MAKPKVLKKGQKVAWNWGSGEGEGEVTQIHKEDVNKTIKGAKITRHASSERPAAEIKTAKGGKVLKSATELKTK